MKYDLSGHNEMTFKRNKFSFSQLLTNFCGTFYVNSFGYTIYILYIYIAN